MLEALSKDEKLVPIVQAVQPLRSVQKIRRTVSDVPVVPVVSVVPDEPLIKLKRFRSLRDIGTVRECLNRQRPFGKADWQVEMAQRFGFASAFRPRGRPRSEKKSSLSPL
jgi:hypothetical protein